MIFGHWNPSAFCSYLIFLSVIWNSRFEILIMLSLLHIMHLWLLIIHHLLSLGLSVLFCDSFALHIQRNLNNLIRLHWLKLCPNLFYLVVAHHFISQLSIIIYMIWNKLLLWIINLVRSIIRHVPLRIVILIGW